MNIHTKEATETFLREIVDLKVPAYVENYVCKVGDQLFYPDENRSGDLEYLDQVTRDVNESYVDALEGFFEYIDLASAATSDQATLYRVKDRLPATRFSGHLGPNCFSQLTSSIPLDRRQVEDQPSLRLEVYKLSHLVESLRDMLHGGRLVRALRLLIEIGQKVSGIILAEHEDMSKLSEIISQFSKEKFVQALAEQNQSFFYGMRVFQPGREGEDDTLAALSFVSDQALNDAQMRHVETFFVGRLFRDVRMAKMENDLIAAEHVQKEMWGGPRTLSHLLFRFIVGKANPEQIKQCHNLKSYAGADEFCLKRYLEEKFASPEPDIAQILKDSGLDAVSEFNKFLSEIAADHTVSSVAELNLLCKAGLADAKAQNALTKKLRSRWDPRKYSSDLRK